MNAPEALPGPATTPALQIIKPEDHDRQKFLGGSDIAAVIGISPWKTRLDLYNDKIRPRRDRPLTRPLTRGIRWEAVVAEMLVERLESEGHKVQIVGSNQRYRDDVHPFMAAEIDFALILDDDEEITNCELKTVHPFKMRDWGDSGSDDLPTHYTAQVMHGLGVTNRRKGMLAALFGADELRTYPVMRDDATVNWLRDQAVAFWCDHVMARVPPAPTTLEDLASLYPAELEGGTPLLADDELVRKLLRMRAIQREIGAREAEAAVLEFEIKHAMRDSAALILPTGKTACEWKLMSGKSLDHELIKAEAPKLYRQAQKPWSSRVFKLKPYSIDGLVPGMEPVQPAANELEAA